MSNDNHKLARTLGRIVGIVAVALLAWIIVAGLAYLAIQLGRLLFA